jgi:hypothetical protein
MLQDLAELVLKCRDQRAKTYIAEAVSCYQGGAYRAAIVATWIAVTYDIIEKLRELTLAGDNEAVRITEEIETNRVSGNVKKSLDLERSLLDVARDKF